MMMQPKLNRYLRADDGQALLETAVTVPLLLLLLVGAAELARANYAAIELANAARAGAQYGAQSPEFVNDSAGITAAAQNEANDIYSLNNATLNVSSSISTICSDGSATTGTPPTCTASTAVVENILTVQTSVTFDPLLYAPTFGANHTFTLKGQASQKVLIQ
jgi:Flp pilus assembly protein TadG